MHRIRLGARKMHFAAKIATVTAALFFILAFHWQKQNSELPSSAPRVVMEKWHHLDRFWYPVAKFEGFGGEQKSNLNLQYCQAAIASWKQGHAKKLTENEIYRCRQQSIWAALWQWSRDKSLPAGIQ